MSRITSARCIALLAAFLGGPAAGINAEEPAIKPAKGKAIAVKLVDGEGKRVAAAELGVMAATGQSFAEQAAKAGTQWLYFNHVRSDAGGMAQVEVAQNSLDHMCLFARHEGRKLAATANVDSKTVDEPVVMTLRPERRLVGQVHCPELDEKNRAIQGGVVYVLCEGNRVLAAQFAGVDFEILLPPGHYSLEVCDSKTHGTIAEVKVLSGSETQQVEPIRLRATRLALLEGQPAPEIPGVVAWKNSPPLTMSDLRGKCVLLDFWGYWCGVCVNHMPEKFELYDKYHDQGLEIIGVHTDLGEDEETPLATVEELDRRLAQAREELWKNRDLPFPVALVVGKQTPFGEEIAQLARSAAAAEWGVFAYPTHILIDRRGNVVGKFWPTDEYIKLLEEKLAEK